MAKALPAKKLAEEEVEVFLMRKIGPERFEVVAGVVKGPLTVTRTLEKNVSIVVGRLTCQRALRQQTEKAIARLGLPAKS